MPDASRAPAGQTRGVARHENWLAPATDSAHRQHPTTTTSHRQASTAPTVNGLRACQPAPRPCSRARLNRVRPTRLRANAPPAAAPFITRPPHLASHLFHSPAAVTTLHEATTADQSRCSRNAARHATARQPVRGDRHGRLAARRGPEGEGPAGAGGAAAAAAGARGGEGVGAVDRAGLRGRQRRAVRRGDVRQQLPGARPRRPRRQEVRRRGVPPPLRLRAPQPEPAPRALLRHIAEAGRARVGQGGARAPGVEARDVHLAPRRRRPPARQHAQPRARRAQARAAVRIRESRRHLPGLRRRGQRDVVPVHQRQHLCGRLRCALRAARRHALGALHQLDHLHQQGGGAGDAAVRDSGEPGDRHPAARGQLRAHRGVPHGVPARVRAAHAPALRLGAALRAAVLRQGRRPEVPGLPVGSARRGLGPGRRRAGGWDGDALPRGERQRALPVVPLPQLCADRQVELREMKARGPPYSVLFRTGILLHRCCI